METTTDKNAAENQRNGDDMVRRMEKIGHDLKEKAQGGIESAGRYIEKHDLSNVTGELTDIIKRHPFQALGLGIGLGVVLGAALSRSR